MLSSGISFTVLKLTAAAVLGALAAGLFWPRHEIAIHTAVGPDIPGTYKHAASACELAGGEILLAYYSGSGEYGRDTAIYATKLNRQTGLWSRPRIVADEPRRAEGNPVLWRAPDGRIWLFYPVRHGDTWATARLAVKLSADEGTSWTAAAAPTDEPGFMTRARPITLADGSCLLPADLNPSTDPEFVSAESGSLFFRSDDGLQSWEATEIIHSRLGNHQPAVARVSGVRGSGVRGQESGVRGSGETDSRPLTPDSWHLVAYCRRGGDYFGREDGRLVRTESFDGGRTWSPGEETDFPNPNSPVDFVRLQSGHLLLAYNDSASRRSPLSVALSTDGTRTWHPPVDIIRGELSYSYPCILQTSDGIIYLFFTAGARSHIKYAVFTEREIANGGK